MNDTWNTTKPMNTALYHLSGCVLFILSGCGQTNADLNNIPELPDSIASVLDTVMRDGVLTNRTDPTTTCPPGDMDLARDINCETTKYFYAQLSYPITICTAPRPKDWETLEQGDPASPREQMRTVRYKLTTLRRSKLTEAMYCTVRGGPWAAEVAQTTDCNYVTSCVLTITGVPLDVPQQLTHRWCGDAYAYPAGLGIFEMESWEDKLPTKKPCGSMSNCSGDGIDPPDSPA